VFEPKLLSLCTRNNYVCSSGGAKVVEGPWIYRDP